MIAFVLAAIQLSAGPCLARQAVDSESDERRFFDFLIGEWTIDDGSDSDYRGDDIYTFRPILDGSGIYSDWYFNRGDAEDPDYTEGVYVTAYDEMSQSWSFYYVSPTNAMFYQGRKEGDNWYFYKSFDIDGDKFLQRQWWELADDSTLIRTIVNSRDDGETWGEAYVRRLVRR